MRSLLNPIQILCLLTEYLRVTYPINIEASVYSEYACCSCISLISFFPLSCNTTTIFCMANIHDSKVVLERTSSAKKYTLNLDSETGNPNNKNFLTNIQCRI